MLLPAIGATLCILMAILGLLSHYQNSAGLIHPALWTMALLMIAGLIWFWLLTALPNSKQKNTTLALIILIGLIMRFIMLPSEPILEIDYYRYLWDGIVVSNGLNPYAISPLEAATGNSVPQLWQNLAKDHNDIVQNINYAPLKTIYPPVAQLFFWVTTFAPQGFELLMLRLVLIGCELISILLLMMLLNQINHSVNWIALYWWNPLIVKELINSAHMDAILLPFLVGAVVLVAKNRSLFASAVLALAAGVKVWPALLAPIFFLRSSLKKLVCVGLVMATLMGLLAWPVIEGRLDGSSGFVAYAALWARNDALFTLIESGNEFILGHFEIHQIDAGKLTRVLIAFSLGGFAIFLGFKGWRNPYKLTHSCLLITTALLLLSPTGYPWYYTWILPFLVIVRFRSLMLLTVLFPFYYLRFYMVEIDQVEIFDKVVVWVEFAPVLALLFWELTSGKKKVGGFP